MNSLARTSSLSAALAMLMIIACGRDPTGPTGNGGHGIALRLMFPSKSAQRADQVAGSLTSIVLLVKRANGIAAIDTTLNFPSNSDSLALKFSVVMPATEMSEKLSVSVALLDVTGIALCTGGPTSAMVYAESVAPAVSIPLSCVLSLPVIDSTPLPVPIPIPSIPISIPLPIPIPIPLPIPIPPIPLSI